MIKKMLGIIDEVDDKSFTLNVGNIFYEIFSSVDLINNLKKGDESVFFIHDAIKENSRELYGFKEKEDRDFFKFMISIRGIGEKTMLGILSEVTTEELKTILYEENLEDLTKLSGIGKKTGEKILTEIRHSIKSFDLKGIKKNNFSKDVISGALSALTTLGLNKSSVEELTNDCYENGMNVSDLISKVLKSKKN
jgi:Holliday junction DNA helicase RuvA